MLKKQIAFCRFLVLAGFVLTLIGCGPGVPKDMPKIYPCKVTITKGGSPVEGASVLLVSTSYPDSFAAAGRTDESGVAEILSTLGTYTLSGAPAGEATLVVTKQAEAPANVRKPKEEVAKMTPPEQNAYAAEIAKAIAALPKIVPQGLTSPATSKAKITVKEEKGGTEMTLELDEY